MAGVDSFNSPSASQDVVVRDEVLARGVVNALDARHLGPGMLPEGLNVSLDDPAKPTTREGYTEVLAGTVGHKNAALPAAALGIFATGPSSRLMVRAVPGQRGGVYYTYNPSDTSGWVEARVRFDQTGEVNKRLDVALSSCPMFQGNDFLWIVGATSLHAMRPDAKIIDCGGSSSAAPPRGAADGCWLLNRVWLLLGNRLYWSKLNPEQDDLIPAAAFDRTDQNTLGNGGGHLNLAPDMSAEAVACRPWRGRSVVCFFKTHIEEIIVDPSNPLNSTRNVLSHGVGCSSREGIIMAGDDMLFPDQYGQIRSLARTTFDTTTGVANTPVSEPIREEIPGRLAKGVSSEVRAARLDDYIYWFYPRDGALRPSHCFRMHLGDGRWEGPWAFANSFSALLTADYGKGANLYAADADSAKTFCMFGGARTDAGAAIEYRERSRAWTMGAPELEKRVYYADLEVSGDIGASARLYARTSENDDWALVADAMVDAGTASSFPILASGFSLTTSDFSLAGGVSNRTTGKQVVTAGREGLELVAGQIPLTEDDLAVPGQFVGMDSGRVVQWEVRCDTLGKRLERVGVRLSVHVDGADMRNTD